MDPPDKIRRINPLYRPVHSKKEDFENGRRDEIVDSPTFRGLSEWSTCLIFDVVLLLAEAVIAIWLASSLYTQDLIFEYRSILVILSIPSFINPLLWICIKSSKTRRVHYNKMNKVFVAVLLFASLNSPLFLFLWHLYQAAMESKKTANKSKRLANTFRMVQATLTSVPILLINMSTLISTLKSEAEGDRVLDFGVLGIHTEKVEFHALAYMISLTNLIRATCLFNERLTYTVMFTIVSLPFIILTVFTRLLALSIVIAFLEVQYSASMFVVLFFSNGICLFMLNKRSTGKQPVEAEASIYSTTASSQNTLPSEEELTHREDKYAENRPDDSKSVPNSKDRQKDVKLSQSSWYVIPKIIAMSVASIIVPVGYSNDFKLHHPRIKGGSFLILNFFSHSIIIGLVLGYTILNYVPNTIHGIKVSNPPVIAQVAESKLSINAFGLSLGLKMPKTNLDLGSMPAMNASVDTDDWDFYISLGIPLPTSRYPYFRKLSKNIHDEIFLALLCLPFAIIRCTMMELDCFITHKKRLDLLDDDDKYIEKLNHTRLTLVDSISRDANSCYLRSRLNISLCCGLFGVFAFPLFSVIAIATIFMMSM